MLSAPGPVVATCIKPDLWAATAAIARRTAARPGCSTRNTSPTSRRHGGGTRSPGWPRWRRPTGWPPTSCSPSTTTGSAISGDRPPRNCCAALLLAAAASSARTLRDVARWLDDPAAPDPGRLLEGAGFRALASSLRGTQHGAPDTRDGIYETARTAAQCMHDEEIMAWVTPPAAGMPVFDPAAFACSRDTLYLLTEDLSAAAPLIAALTDTAIRAARRAAERAGGRLDPPHALILDEAANICRIADLPQLYSHLGSRGIVPVTILQSYEQGVTVWGEHGMAALWGAATKKLIGAGLDSPRLTRDLATLIGQHDVPVRSASYGDGRSASRSRCAARTSSNPRHPRPPPRHRAASRHRGKARADPAEALVHGAICRPDHRGGEPGRAGDAPGRQSRNRVRAPP